uniref:Ribosomal protein S2 n=1 Tax=Andalucia godoyi TaxID=505711 RepID=M4QKL6_ANDGO|nr:ribosomal protein S2 [Andalucia godoyi]AGH24013.1 ribosomal protein S2 [Andalucia godoyi]
MNITIQKLMDVGAHYGSLVSKWNPKMSPYLYGQRNQFCVIDLEKTLASLKRSMHVLREIQKTNGRVLFVGTDEMSSQCVRYYARQTGQSYLHQSWPAGFLTNWNHFSAFLQEFNRQESTLNPKKDMKTYKKHVRLSQSLEGVRHLTQLPSLLVVFNTEKHRIAIQEANIMKIPVIGIVDTDCNPDGITYVIPGNNDNVSCMKFYAEFLSQAWKE